MNCKLGRVAALVLIGLSGNNAFAMSDGVELYGILDLGVARVAHSLGFDPNHPVGVIPYANANGDKSVTGMFNGGLSASRWGIRGAESIDGGLRAFFVLESAINVPSGAVSNAAASMANNKSTGPSMSADSAISGQFFARQSRVGLESETWGSVSMGRHQSFFLETIADFDPMLGSQIFSPIGFSGTYGGGGNTEDSRIDNSVRYQNKVGDVTLGAQYKFGEVAGEGQARSAYQLNAVYKAGDLGMQLGYQRFKDAFAASNGTPVGTLSVTANDTEAIMAAVRYTMGKTTLRAGYEREELSNPSHPALDGITTLFGYPVSSINVNPYAITKKLNVYWVGANHAPTSNWVLSAAYYQVNQNDSTGNGCAAASAKCSGITRFESLLADYVFSKRTDVYAGLMMSQASDGMAFKYLHTTNAIVGTGIRHRF